MKRIKLFVILIFSSIYIGYGQEKNDIQTTQEHSKWRVHDAEQYVISHPIDWELDQSGQMGTSFMLFSEVASSEDRFRENANLIIQDLTGYNMNMDSFIELSEEQIRTMLVDGKIISSDRIQKDESEFHRINFSGKQGIFDLEFDQLCIIRDEKAYVLTITYETTQKDNYKEIGEQILDSFRVKDY